MSGPTPAAARAVLFDLDGTLVDSLGDIADAANWALATLGLPPHSEDDYRRFVGEGVDRLAERVLGVANAHRRPELLAAFKPRYAVHMLDRTAPFPGIPALLDELEARGLPLAVLSNKPEPATQHMVARLFPGRRWAVVAGDVPGIPRKPDPGRALAIAAAMAIPPAGCLLVGDTSIDVLTALAAGMVAVGVGWGFRPRAELEAAGAQVMLAEPADLLRKIAPRSG